MQHVTVGEGPINFGENFKVLFILHKIIKLRVLKHASASSYEASSISTAGIRTSPNNCIEAQPLTVRIGVKEGIKSARITNGRKPIEWEVTTV